MNVREKDRASLRFADFREVDASAKDGEKFADFSYAWKNGGKRRDGSTMTMKDALATWEAPLFIPKVINNAIQEAVEPLLIGQSLLQRIPFTPGTYIDLPVMGAVDGDFDVGEEESFPELRVTYGPGAQIGRMPTKSGVAVRFTEEVLRYSQFDVVSMHVRQAAKALARHKEEKIFNMLYRVASTTHDNANPNLSAFGSTTGRDLTGAMNGAITLDDIFEMYSQILHNGYMPDMLLLHPLTWLMFVQDAQLRAFAQMNQSTWFGSQWSGNPGQNDFQSLQGGEGVTGGAERFHPATYMGNQTGTAGQAGPLPVTVREDFSAQMKAAPVLPAHFGIPLRVIVSPFVPYDATDNTTTILMADSSQLGFYIEDYGLQTSEWKNPETDILKIKMKEAYTLREKNRGLGLAVAKKVVVTANQIILPAQSTIGVNGSIDLADRTAVVP